MNAIRSALLENVFTKHQISKYDSNKNNKTLLQHISSNKLYPTTLTLQRINHETLASAGTANDWFSFLTTKHVDDVTTNLKTDFKDMDPPTTNGSLLATILTTLNNHQQN